MKATTVTNMQAGMWIFGAYSKAVVSNPWFYIFNVWVCSESRKEKKTHRRRIVPQNVTKLFHNASRFALSAHGCVCARKDSRGTIRLVHNDNIQPRSPEAL